MYRSALLCAALVLLIAGPAHAVPGDPLPAPLAPADGATVAAGASGVQLDFTCPNYRQSPSGEAATDSIVGYGVEVSTDPAFGGTILGTSAIQPAATPGQCTAFAHALGGGPLQAPGTYYWRVTRFCFCDGTDTEYGPTTSFVVRAASATLKATGPRRAYAGYTTLVTLQTDLADGQPVTLERKAKGGWKTVGRPVEVADGRASAPIELARGQAQVRWSARRGTQVDRSAPLTIAVARAGAFSTGASDDGAYRAQGQANVTFQVARSGREIRDLRAQVSVYCIGGPDVTDNRIVSAVAIVKRVRVAPDGTFYAASTVSRTDTTVSGRLHGGKVTGGSIELAYPLCSGRLRFSASRS